MTRLVSIGFLATLLAALAACASDPPSGTATQRGTDRWSPVDDFPQARGTNSYMRQ
jgi:hypothetical protein